MDYLQLVQRVHQESGSGGTTPASLDALSGENQRLKDWVNLAYKHIQNQYIDWKFMWAQSSFTCVIDQAVYTPLNNPTPISPSSQVKEYDRDTFYIDGQPMDVVNYIDVKGEVFQAESGSPSRIIIMPNDSLKLDPPPSAESVISFDYWGSATEMVEGTDEPRIPEQYHMAIVGKALTYYAQYESADEQMAHGADIYTEFFGALEADQLPGNRYAHRMAEGNELEMHVE